jgi:enoyl-CoA hydratase/carnithine racemase
VPLKRRSTTRSEVAMAEGVGAEITERAGVVVVTFDRPEKRNAISPEMTALLWEATTALADRDDLRCMVITGKGPYFTAGIDLRRPVGNRPGDPATARQHPGWNFRRNYRSHHLLYDELETIEKPVILAAQGHCYGAGVEMAASCDFRFCTPATEFWLPEVEKLGVIAGSGGTSRLTRLVGPAWGKWIAMAGMPVAAEQAKAIGLVHDVFPADTFLDDVMTFCQRLISMPAEALGMAKLAVDIHADVSDRTVQRHIDRVFVSSWRPSFHSTHEPADADTPPPHPTG